MLDTMVSVGLTANAGGPLLLLFTTAVVHDSAKYLDDLKAL